MPRHVEGNEIALIARVAKWVDGAMSLAKLHHLAATAGSLAERKRQ